MSEDIINLGRYIIQDPEICHGKPTFKGTRILVVDILDQLSNGMDWESIIEEWHGSINKEAIKEAIFLAKKAFMEKVPV